MTGSRGRSVNVRGGGRGSSWVARARSAIARGRSLLARSRSVIARARSATGRGRSEDRALASPPRGVSVPAALGRGRSPARGASVPAVGRGRGRSPARGGSVSAIGRGRGRSHTRGRGALGHGGSSSRGVSPSPARGVSQGSRRRSMTPEGTTALGAHHLLHRKTEEGKAKEIFYYARKRYEKEEEDKTYFGIPEVEEVAGQDKGGLPETSMKPPKVLGDKSQFWSTPISTGCSLPWKQESPESESSSDGNGPVFRD